MENSELLPIISGLIRKSEKKEVNWIHSSEIDPRVSDTEEDYTVKLDKSSINVYKYVPDFGSEELIVFRIENDRGKEIFRESFSPNDDYYNKLQALIGLAANKVDNIDETIKSIERALNSSGEIGQAAENDIPF